jgi:cytidine deaminase
MKLGHNEPLDQYFLRNIISPIIDSASFQAVLNPDQIRLLLEKTRLSPNELALSLLPLSYSYAMAPISELKVGAIAHGRSGFWYFGANIELSGAPIQQTIHAEQSAIVNAWLHDECAISHITISHIPCGYCRQFLNELNNSHNIYINIPDRQCMKLIDYLPFSFGPNDLNITDRLLDRYNHGYLLQGDGMSQTAIREANSSYAPYSRSHSGIALRTESGKIIGGRYAENSAFNPSLSALQVALVSLNIQRLMSEKIQKAVIAEKGNTKLSQCTSTQSILHNLGCKNVTCIQLESDTSVG